LPKGSSDGSSTDGTSSREDIRTLRIKKVEDMRTGGYEPYGYTWERTDTAQELQSKYADLASATEANEEKDHVSVAGRIMARRVFGKLAFLTLRDDSGPIQLYCEKARIKDAAFDQLKTSLDVGDFVGAKGTIKRTEKGELSVLVEELAILTKSLLPLPDKWHGLTDIEKRYRQRYVDMIMNPDVAEVFRSRARITSEIRRHMDNLGFLEIETPVLQVDHPLQVFCILLHAFFVCPCVWRIV
jgi:lysyl-tRNA synthetase class 2